MTYALLDVVFQKKDQKPIDYFSVPKILVTFHFYPFLVRCAIRYYEFDDYTQTFFLLFQVRYTAYRDRPLHERQTKFICSLREGHTEIVRKTY